MDCKSSCSLQLLVRDGRSHSCWCPEVLCLYETSSTRRTG